MVIFYIYLQHVYAVSSPIPGADNGSSQFDFTWLGLSSAHKLIKLGPIQLDSAQAQAQIWLS